MSAVKKFLSLLLCLCLLGVLSTPAFAGDRDVSVQDLKGIPKRHRFLTSIVGGAALGEALELCCLAAPTPCGKAC
jgi:hypothetical protein